MNVFEESIEKLDVDAIMLSKINLKCATPNASKMNQRMKRLGRETQAFIADSRE